MPTTSIPVIGTPEEQRIFTQIHRHYTMARDDLEQRTIDFDKKDILMLIGNKKEYHKYVDFILSEVNFITSKESALKYIGKYSIHPIPSEKRIIYATQILEIELFPHLGLNSSPKEKAIFIGHMIDKLLSTSLKMRSEDDKDNISNKRYESTGILFNELFRSLYKRWLDRIKEQVIKHGDALALSQALRIQPLKRKDILSWISFPIPFNPDTITVDSPNRYYWHSGTPFGNGGMEKLARNLEKAVPKK